MENEKQVLFLSHSSRDVRPLTVLKDSLLTLTSGAIDIFLSSDGQSIPFGTNWVAEVERALKRAKVMFTFLSPAALDSEWVLFESGFAYGNGVKVVPIGVFGVHLESVGPPLSLLQGFNLARPKAMGNLAKIINEEFGLRCSESWGEEEYSQIFERQQIYSDTLFGNFTEWITRLNISTASVHEPDSGEVESFLEDLSDDDLLVVKGQGASVVLPGVEIPLRKGRVRIKADPILSSVTFPILSKLIPFLAGEEKNKEDYHLEFILRDPVEAHDSPAAIGARIYGTDLHLSEGGFVSLQELRLRVRRRSVTTGYSSPGSSSSMGPGLGPPVIHHTRPAGVEITGYFEGDNLEEAPFEEALQILFDVGVLYFAE